MSVVHTELSEAIDRLVPNPTICGLYRQWQEYADGDRLPAFSHFDPQERPPVAGNLMILEPREDAFRYVYYGARIAAAAGFDMTGRSTTDFHSEVGTFFEQKYREVLKTGRPLYTVHNAEHASAVVSWERLILPVARDGRPWIVCYNAPLDRKAEILDGLMDASMDGITVLQPQRDPQGSISDFRFVMVNRRAGTILNRDPESLIGRTITETYPDAVERIPIYREVLETGQPTQFEITAELDGETRNFRLSAVKAGDKVVITLSDITGMRRMMDQLQQQQSDLQFANESLEDQASSLVALVEDIEQARADARSAERFVVELMEAVPVPLFYWNLDSSMKRANRHYAAVYGHTPESIVGKTPEDLLPPHLARFLREQNVQILNDGSERQTYQGDVEIPGRGRRRFVVHRAVMHDPSERPIGIAGAMLDVTEEYHLRRELERLASTDPLTGLYNRRVVMERLEEQVVRFRRHRSPAAVVLLDVDHFKSVNDTYGHDFGDVVLTGLARLLDADVREGDIVARFGGEEFLVLLPDTDGPAAVTMAERLRAGFAGRTFETPAGERRFTASFGVAALAEGDDVASLLKRADEALYRSKEAGRDRVTLSETSPASPPASAAR